MSSLELTGVIGISEGSCGCEGNSTGIDLSFEGGSVYFDRILRTETAVEITSSSFVQLPLAGNMTTISFVNLSAINGTTPTLLIGDKPSWLGIGGTFPTGFVGGETFTFAMQTYNPATGNFSTDSTIAVVFDAADQTASDVARRINSVLALAGFGSLTSVVAGQLVIDGPEPGADKRLANVVANAVIGYGGTAGANGTGTPLVLTGVFMAQLNTIPGDNFWIKGPGWLNILLAGT